MKLFAGILLTLSLLLIGVNAHVSFTVSNGVIGGSSIVGQFQIPHGCFVNGVGQDTLSLTATLPTSLGSIEIADVPNFTSLTATLPNGGGTLIQWTAIPPYTLIGNVTRIQWFPVSFKIQSSVANNTMIYMPALQSCANNASVYWNNTQANNAEGSTVNPAPSLRALLPNTNPGNPSVIIMNNNSDNGWKSSDTLSVIAIVLSGVVMLIQLTQCFATKKSVPGNHYNTRNNQNYIVANKKSPSNVDLAAKQNNNNNHNNNRNNNNNNTQRTMNVRSEVPATETANNSESNTPVHENETGRAEAVEFHV